jgi:hypothetical protein
MTEFPTNRKIGNVLDTLYSSEGEHIMTHGGGGNPCVTVN